MKTYIFTFYRSPHQRAQSVTKRFQNAAQAYQFIDKLVRSGAHDIRMSFSLTHALERT
jgi:hypothetical protein